VGLLFLFVHLVICVWILFLGGAKSLEGSFSTLFFFYPAMTVRDLKFYSALSLVVVPFYFLG
jgi:hypothetical protein